MGQVTSAYSHTRNKQLRNVNDHPNPLTATFLFLSLFFLSFNTLAAHRVVDLTVSYKTVFFAGKSRKAIVVNNQLPAPTLHFKEGDHVTIHVHNQLDQETAIHWHGILVPWQMDGVLGITQQGIPPGGVFHYQFTLHQSGTYWYHAHAGLEEQQGLYGAFLIDPKQQPNYQYTKDYVIVLSDWSNTDPEHILANLKKEGDYYSPRFPLQPSLAKFIHDYRKASPTERQRLTTDYKMMQQMRMNLYDMSDVAYDAFLLNGHSPASPWKAKVHVGDVVRLRFIGAAGSTIFHVKIPGTTMQLVQVDGNDVIPQAITTFTLAPGETYDVLVKIQKKAPYLIYAESIDTLSAAYGALITTPKQRVNYAVKPFPEPLPVTREMMSMMMAETMTGRLPSLASATNLSSKRHSSQPMTMPGMKMDDGMKMNHAMSHSANKMRMPTEPTRLGDQIAPPDFTYVTSVGTKYQSLQAAIKTNDPDKPVAGVIHMELFGYMDRFIWFINGVPEYHAKPIRLLPGKRYRIIFTNTSMMHHPMHIHGHWFILRKGLDAYDPLLHTIDVAPGATITADVDTDASGQWFFHCHLLYHMVTGMSRVLQYSTLIDITKHRAKPEHSVKRGAYHNRPQVRVDEVRPLDVSLVTSPMAHPAGFWLATWLEAGIDPFQSVGRLTYKGLYGPDDHKLELFVNDAEINQGKVENADIDIFYWHFLDQFWAIKGGANYTYRPAKLPYWQPGLGLEGTMPYFIETDLRGYYKNGSVKVDLTILRNTQLTSRLYLRTELRGIAATKTVSSAAIGVGLNQLRYLLRPYYRFKPGLTLFVEYEHEQDYGAFRRFQISSGNESIQNTITFGLAALF